MASFRENIREMLWVALDTFTHVGKQYIQLILNLNFLLANSIREMLT